MSIIQVQDLTFAYEGSYEPIFAHVSLQLDTNWRLGLVGRNGRGKTTFLRLLAGELDAGGAISAGVGFEYFPYPVLDASLSAQDVAAGISGADEWRIRREFNLLGISEDAAGRPFSTLSPGEGTKALLAALFCKPNQFLLIDEPTNHLDAQTRAAVSRYLAKKSGFILVSHDRAFLDGCIDHVLSINRGSIELLRGNFATWDENRRRRESFETAENERLGREIDALRASAERASLFAARAESEKFGTGAGDRGYLGHKAAKMMKRGKAIENRMERAADEKAGLLKNVERNDALIVRPLHHHKDALVLVRDLVVRYGGRAVNPPLRFDVLQGGRVALAGPNGSGKSSVLRLFNGEDVPHTGAVETAAGLVISYLPQDPSFLAGSAESYASECGVDLTLFYTILRKLDFPRAQFEKDMALYSAGQKKKVLLARSLSQRAHLYLWDEPLNYVDVLSRMQIEDLLLLYAPTMVFIEHDAAFAARIATQVVAL